MKLSLVKSLGIAALVACAPVAALAVTVPPPAPGTVLSDFATDVKNGQDQLKTDPAAKTGHDEVAASETQDGNIDDGDVDVDTDVHEEEASETQDAADQNGDAKDSGSGVTDHSSDSGGTSGGSGR